MPLHSLRRAATAVIVAGGLILVTSACTLTEQTEEQACVILEPALSAINGVDSTELLGAAIDGAGDGAVEGTVDTLKSAVTGVTALVTNPELHDQLMALHSSLDGMKDAAAAGEGGTAALTEALDSFSAGVTDITATCTEASGDTKS